jgi:exodeoxyribonuclease VII small subunit
VKPKNQVKEVKFEDSLKRLEELVQEMESGELPLEDILKKYEEGNKLIKFCASKLNEAEKRIEILMKEKDGSIGMKEFDLDEEQLEEEVAEAVPEKNEKPDEGTEETKDLF